MVSDPETNSVIRWNPNGDCFLIVSPEKLDEVFRRYFASKKFSSFVRQLNLYGFHKKGPPEHWEFYHDLFLRGRTDLLPSIKRRTPVPGARKRAAEGPRADIAVLMKQREHLQQEVLALRVGQTALETSIQGVTMENARLLEEIQLSRQEQAEMQDMVASILGLLSKLDPSGGIAALHSSLGKKRSASYSSLERPAKRPRVERPSIECVPHSPEEEEETDGGGSPFATVPSVDALFNEVDMPLELRDMGAEKKNENGISFIDAALDKVLPSPDSLFGSSDPAQVSEADFDNFLSTLFAH